MSMMLSAGRQRSFVMLFKGMVGFSIAALALLGVLAPHIGMDPAAAHEGAAVGIGAVVGAILSLRA